MPAQVESPSDRSRATGPPGTDPSETGPLDPYESLYRNPGGGTGRPTPTPRDFQPALRPPEGADDTFGWLYRPEPHPAAPASTLPPAVPPAAPAPAPVMTAASTTATVPRAGWGTDVPPPVRPRRRRGVLAVLLTLGVAAGAVAGVVAATHSGAEPRRSTVAPVGSASPASGPASPGPVPVASVAADCTAPAARDDAGHRVTYAPALAADGDARTAWRCNGSGVGRTLTFRFAGPVLLSQVGLVNGYAKVDPTSGVSRYGQYRRITEVRWTFPDGSTLDQTLTDRDEQLQTVTFPARRTDQVTMTIEATTAPGQSLSTRDAVLVSDTLFTAS